MKTILAGCAVAALFVGAAQAKPVAYEVQRAGDAVLTCQALSSEISTLDTEVAELNAKAAKKAKTGKMLGRGLLSGLAQAAPMLAYAGGGNGGIATQIAGSAAQGMARQALADSDKAPEAPAAPADTPQQRRLTHLNDLYRSKPC